MSEITIQVFEVLTEKDIINDLHLEKKLYDLLKSTGSAKSRLMKTTDEQDKCSDFILGFNLNQNFLFGSFARLTEDAQTSILTAQLEEENIDINKIVTAADENNAGFVQDVSFFCIQNDVLTLTNSRKNVRRFETYINWLLREKLNSPIQIKILPKIKTADKIPLDKISKIQITDSILDKNSTSQKIGITKKQAIKFLKEFILDAKSKKELDYEEIVSAIVTIKINKKGLEKGKTPKDLNTLFKVVSSDDVVIYDNKGNRISGSQYEVKVKRTIEKIKGEHYNKNQIETEMRNIIKQVLQNEVVV